MKKILSLLLLVLMITPVFVSCGGSCETTITEAPTTNPPVSSASWKTKWNAMVSEKSVKVNEIVIHRDKVSADYTEDKRVKLTQTEEINDFISMLSGLEFETISKESFPPSLVPVGYVVEIINDGELNVSSETGNVVYNETGMDKKYAMQIFVSQYGDVYVKERSYVPEDGNYFGYMGDGDTLFKSKTAIDFNVVHNAFLKET